MPLRYHNGDAFGFTYNGEEYYYIKNVQNDIVAIANKNGTVVANYYYDAWGNVTQITGKAALHGMGDINGLSTNHRQDIYQKW